MNNQKNKKEIIGIIKRLDIQREFKDILIKNIDILDLKKMVMVIRKYTEKISNIREKNNIIKQDFNKQINKCKNTYEEYNDEMKNVSELEYLIRNM